MSLLAVPFSDIFRGSFPSVGSPKINLNNPSLKIGDIITVLLPYIFVLGGLLLLGYLVWGGIELMTSRGDPKGVESAKGKVTAALIGFIIIFVSYWLVRILGEILSIDAIRNIFQ